MNPWRRPVALLFVAGLAGFAGVPVRAAAPAGRYSVSAEVVKDNETGLIWQRAAAPGTFTWTNAKLYCPTLALSGGGWRLPNVRELETLVDVRAFSPSIDTTAFPGTPSGYFWSSSRYAINTAFGWAVSFDTGETHSYIQSGTYSVRCVK